MINGTLWTLVQRWGVRLTTLIVFVVLGRLLDPTDFGVVALAGVFVGVLNVFSDFGLSTYLVQAPSIDQRTKSTVFWCGLIFSVVVAAALVAASAWISALFQAPDMRVVLMALAASIVITAFSTTQTALLKRALNFRTIALRSLVATLTAAVVAIGLALAGQGVWALVAQSLVFNATSAVVLWTATGWRPDLIFDRGAARHALRYGGSVLGVQLVSQVRHRADALVIGLILGTTALGYWT
ncbi:MAG: oligosaccharide flippase family protein, partial [Actinomycetes bacterium]